MLDRMWNHKQLLLVGMQDGIFTLEGKLTASWEARNALPK